ncbi:MAG: M23 family metallopeptidase [Sphingomonadales bacterium]|nr:M23 family metallopeptidase [Sphingomonadales bacterium]
MIRLALATTLVLTISAPASAVEIRTCDGPLRNAPLSDERNVQSALLQAFAVVNTEAEPVVLTGVHFRLKAKGEVIDTQLLKADDIARAAKQGPTILALAQQLPSQFCNGSMLKGASPAKSSTLAPGEAIIFIHQPLVWRGARDRLEIGAVTDKQGVLAKTLTSVTIESAMAKTQALYPVAGASYVAAAGSFHTHHRWLTIEEFALDILAIGTGGLTYRGKGTKLTDYAAFGRPIRAVADGRVVRVTFATRDNVAMRTRPGESSEAYLARLMAAQGELIAQGIEAVLGNHVVIDPGNGEFSVYAHLKRGSPRVVEGQSVKAGETIGALGSSGNSTEPHLHSKCATIPT